MKKKIISLCLVVVLALTAVGGATLAYFTDSGKQENTFAIGNIKIKVDEWGYVWDSAAKSYVNGATKASTGGFEFSKLMPSYIISKEPAVFNTGANDAYVRVAVTVNNLQAINDAIDNFYEAKGYSDEDIQTIYNNVFAGWGINYTKTQYNNGEYAGTEAQTVRGWMNQNRTFTNIITANKVQKTFGGATLIGIDYATKVGKGNSSYERYSPLNMFQSDDEVANNTAWEESGNYSNGTFNSGDGRKTYYSKALADDSRVYVFYFKIPAGKDTGALFGGLNIPAEFNNEQMKMFENLKIGVYADAIQTAGFNNASDAFAALEAEHPIGWWNESSSQSE